MVFFQCPAVPKKDPSYFTAELILAVDTFS